MTKEHLGLALALQVPVFVVVTKIDMCPANVLDDTLKLLQRILKSPGCRKMPVLVQNKDDVVCSATNFSSERYSCLVLLLFFITLQYTKLGPVIQSNISLMSLLVVKMLSVLVSTISDSQVFLLKRCE